MRTFTSHKQSVLDLDFHPYGDFFASVSADHTLKVWDIRKKVVLQTYNGHNAPVHIVRISPDGKWVMSAAEDGAIKVITTALYDKAKNS